MAQHFVFRHFANISILILLLLLLLQTSHQMLLSLVLFTVSWNLYIRLFSFHTPINSHTSQHTFYGDHFNISMELKLVAARVRLRKTASAIKGWTFCTHKCERATKNNLYKKEWEKNRKEWVVDFEKESKRTFPFFVCINMCTVCDVCNMFFFGRVYTFSLIYQKNYNIELR